MPMAECGIEVSLAFLGRRVGRITDAPGKTAVEQALSVKSRRKLLVAFGHEVLVSLERAGYWFDGISKR